MNKENNKRALNSKESIEKAFIDLLDKYNIKKITVQSICNLAHVNRTTFYAHYADIYDLEEKIEEKLSAQFIEIFEGNMDDTKKMEKALCEMFFFIKEHRNFYKVFLKYNNLSTLKNILNRTNASIDDDIMTYYNISFFSAGISAMLRIWLQNNCREKPKELVAMCLKRDLSF